MLSTNLKDWSEVHVFYNNWNSHLTSNKSRVSDMEMAWKEFVLEKTPNGHLFTQNNFFDQLHNDEIYIAHVTPNLHNITKDNLIYPSGGCLVGSVYCVPVSKVDKGFRLHNLGSFIYKKEVPKISGVTPKILLIKIELPDNCKNRLIGIDYLRLGSIHFNLFKELEYLLSSEERYILEKTCEKKTQELLPLLIMTQNKILEQKVDKNCFFEQFYKQIPNNPILAYIFFEIFCEFTALFQKSEESEKWKANGEIFTWYFKNSVFTLADNSYFNLRTFQPKIEQIFKYLSGLGCLDGVDYSKVEEYFFNRISYILFTKLWNNDNPIGDWRKLLLTFDNLTENFRPLLGHIIHRELRNFGRYPDFYFYFDQMKALEIWNYWNHSNILIPFNGIMPKGEIGINPAFPELKFEIFETEILTDDSSEIFVIPKNKIRIEFVPKLVDLKFTTLRNRQHEKNES